jgi:hypothetical protein
VTSSELSEGVDISVFFAATTNHSSLIFTKLWLISAPLFASIADPATKRGRILPPTLVRFETQFAFSRYLLPNLWQCDRRGCQADGVLLLAISMLSLDALIESL